MLSYFRKVGGASLVIAGVHKLQDHAMLAYLKYGNARNDLDINHHCNAFEQLIGLSGALSILQLM